MKDGFPFSVFRFPCVAKLLFALLGGRGGFGFAHAGLCAAGRAFFGFATGVDGGAAFFTGKDSHDSGLQLSYFICY
jgi:hypothetical protein